MVKLTGNLCPSNSICTINCLPLFKLTLPSTVNKTVSSAALVASNPGVPASSYLIVNVPLLTVKRPFAPTHTSPL